VSSPGSARPGAESVQQCRQASCESRVSCQVTMAGADRWSILMESTAPRENSRAHGVQSTMFLTAE